MSYIISNLSADGRRLVSTLQIGLLVACLQFAGCVTESSGGIPGPAPSEARVQAQLGLARGYIERRDLSRAKVPLGKALGIDPDHVEARVLYAVLLQSESEFELAEVNYRAALKSEPRHPQALNNYGSFLYARERFAQAIEVLSKLVQDTTYRSRPQAFENLALAYLQAGRNRDAVAAFRRALALNFRQPRSNLELADIEYQNGNFDAAQSQLIAFKAYARHNARSMCLSLKVAQALGKHDEVASNALALKNLYPEQAEQCQAKT